MQNLVYNIGPCVRAFSTTRHGGFSKGAFGEFNINPYCGDDAEAVKKNRCLLAEELHLNEGQIILPHQTHQTEICYINENFFCMPQTVQKEMLEGIDAVITDVGGICIGVSTADCIPVLLYDTVYHVACAVHAGWRGTVKRIVEKAIAEMQCLCENEPANLKAIIGPGISLEAFEVGDEVFEEFKDAGFSMSGISTKIAGKWHIDLPECNRQQLLQAGLSEENIQLSGICTYNNPEDFFSARRLGIKSGRIYTGIILR